MYIESAVQEEAGRCGKAFSFVKGKEVYKLKDIQRYARQKSMHSQFHHLMMLPNQGRKDYGPDFHHYR